MRAVFLPLAAALAAAPALSAEDPKDLYKGRVKPGFYEVVTEYDLTGVPEVPRSETKGSEKRRRCLSEQDLSRGVQPTKECDVKAYNPSATSASMTMGCTDGTSTELRYTFSAAGFASEAKTTGKQQDGKPFTSLFRTQARYLGACPAQAPAPAAPPPRK